MSKMAKYASIIWAEPTNDDVQARNGAVDALKSDLSKLTTRQAVEAASTIAQGFGGAELSELLAPKAEKAISDRSAAFVLKGSEQQAVICLAVAALALVQEPVRSGDGWTAIDALAASLWSALTFQNQLEHAKMEELRKDVLEACRSRVHAVAKAARLRQDVPDVGTLTIAENDAGGSRANAAYKKATAPVIKALKENQDLDREELDFLWWVLSEYSELLGGPLTGVTPLCRAIASGLEGATLLRRLPADGFRHAVLRTVESTDVVSLAALLTALAAERTALGKHHEGTWPVTLPAVFPLIATLASGDAASACEIELDARDWGSRALLEASIIAMEGRQAGAA
jgi:hypothetical protein